MANKIKPNKKATVTEKLPVENTEPLLVKDIISDERTSKITGAFLLMIALFFFIAFTSYLFTWQEDQDKVFQLGISILAPNNLNIENLLGSFGAFISHFFIYKGFGLASYLFCFFLFALGTNLTMGSKMFSIKRNAKYLIVGLLIFSLSFSFITKNVFPTTSFSFGGYVGNVLSDWTSAFLGKLGTFIFIVVVFFAYFIWRFNPVFSIPRIGKKQQDNAAIPEPVIAVEPPIITEEEDILPPTAGKNKFRGKPEKLVITPLPQELDNELIIIQKNPDTEEDNLVMLPNNATVEVNNGLLDIPSNDFSLVINHPAPPEPQKELTAQEKVAQLPPYDPILDLRDYKYPGIELLDQHGNDKIVTDAAELEANKNQIINTLKNYDIGIQRIFATVGPTVTLYEIVPAAGVRISRIKNLEDDIALSLSALGIRIIAPIPGKGTIGIEVPNVKKSIVSMRTLLANEKFQNSTFALPIALGKKIDNEHFIVDLAAMPHLLMAGATGQGKSVGINAILVSLLYKKHPSQLKFVLVDPKKVELSLYRVIEKHFLAKLPGEEEAIITDTRKVVHTLNALCIEMDTRYDLLKEAQCRNIREYNEKFAARKLNPEKGHQYLPFIVLVIDEFADLIMTAGKEIEMPIGRLAQLARAVGIHLIIATQRPSVNIITGTIKANFPARIAFKVSSKIDSRTILDAGGAEQLIGRGDMLISNAGEISRLQCVFVDTPEVERVVEFIGNQRGYPQAFMLPEYVDEKDEDGKAIDVSERDPLFEDAARLIVQMQIGSTSLIQRRMKLGYNRAGRLMDQLEAAGIVGNNQGSKAREVLLKTEYELEQMLRNNL
jgi:S-DNA-T family DNA segregation ATPase FtsK/SpoIIIE